MQKPLFASVLVGCLATIAVSAEAAQSLAIMPISGVNLHQGYQQIAQDLLKDHLMTSGKFQVVLVPGTPSPSEPNITQAMEAGRTAGTELVLFGHIIRLQNMFRIRINVVKVASGELIHADSLSSTGGPDQLDTVLMRLAQAFARGERAGSNAEIDSVTQRESDPYLKQTATRTFGLRLGAILPLNRPAGDVAASPGLGLFWLYDARDYMAEAFVDFHTTGDSQDETSQTSSFDVGLGMYRPFSRKNITAYAGGAVAFSVVDYGGRGANGLRFNGAFGVLFGRLSNVQIRGELGYFINAFSEKVDEYSYASYTTPTAKTSSKSALAHGPMLMAGIGF